MKSLYNLKSEFLYRIYILAEIWNLDVLVFIGSNISSYFWESRIKSIRFRIQIGINLYVGRQTDSLGCSKSDPVQNMRLERNKRLNVLKFMNFFLTNLENI